MKHFLRFVIDESEARLTRTLPCTEPNNAPPRLPMIAQTGNIETKQDTGHRIS